VHGFHILPPNMWIVSHSVVSFVFQLFSFTYLHLWIFTFCCLLMWSQNTALQNHCLMRYRFNYELCSCSLTIFDVMFELPIHLYWFSFGMLQDFNHIHLHTIHHFSIIFIKENIFSSCVFLAQLLKINWSYMLSFICRSYMLFHLLIYQFLSQYHNVLLNNTLKCILKWGR
jgi:hypothetical protein